MRPFARWDAEFGRPQWLFDLSTYGSHRHQPLFAHTISRVATIWPGSIFKVKTLTLVDLLYTGIWYVAVSGQQTLIGAGSPVKTYAVMLLDIDANTAVTLKLVTTFVLDTDFISVPQLIEFPIERGLTAFAWFYPPPNPSYEAPSSERPPLLVEVHGGPTGSCDTNFNLHYQYWTTRGYAIVAVDYGGSTGYGRPYRERLNGHGVWSTSRTESMRRAIWPIRDWSIVSG